MVTTNSKADKVVALLKYTNTNKDQLKTLLIMLKLFRMIVKNTMKYLGN